MKFLLALCLIYVLSGFHQSSPMGIQFREDKFSEIRKLAATENKAIFIDAYTLWCGPCKLMDKTIFSDPEVGKLFNNNFINVKIDMEEKEGLLLGRKYNVHFYPTLLFIKPDGALIAKEVGFQEKAQLIKIANEILQAPL